MIKYVCISDLHAGALTSLLTDRKEPFQPFDPTIKSPVTLAFAEALGAFVTEARKAGGEAPQLILLGDTLELQYAKRHEAVTNAIGFLSELSPFLAPDVIATAGNHDHALWTDARLALHGSQLTTDRATADYREATRAFTPDKGAESRLMTAMLKHSGFDKCDFRYPNIGFQNEERAILLHHGHFSEDLYYLMSTLMTWLTGRSDDPLTVDTLSAENAGWLDFAWAALGDAAGNGRVAELIYQNILTTTGFRRLSTAWAEKIADALSEAMPLSGNLTVQETIHNLTRAGLDKTIGSFRDSQRFAEVISLTAEARAQLQWYVNGPCCTQIHKEFNDMKREVPNDLTFVLGHTHKPYADRLMVDRHPSSVKVYNTGGWTLNGPRLDNAEGASMVLIDHDMNTAAVRLFSTPQNGVSEKAYVEALHDGPGSQTFAKDIDTWLKKTDPVWENLAEVTRGAYQRRQEFLIKLTGFPKDRMEAAE